jgi:hypothetical protein
VPGQPTRRAASNSNRSFASRSNERSWYPLWHAKEEISTVAHTSFAETSSLPTCRFGRTDIHITRVGFGAWAINGARLELTKDDLAEIGAVIAVTGADIGPIAAAA